MTTHAHHQDPNLLAALARTNAKRRRLGLAEKTIDDARLHHPGPWPSEAQALPNPWPPETPPDHDQDKAVRTGRPDLLERLREHLAETWDRPVTTREAVDAALLLARSPLADARPAKLHVVDRLVRRARGYKAHQSRP